MIQRIALLAGGLGAAAVFLVALGLTGQPAAAQVSNGGPGSSPELRAQATVVTDKVYIAPAPSASIVRVRAQTPDMAAAQPATPAGHDDGDNEESGHSNKHSDGHHDHHGDD